MSNPGSSHAAYLRSVEFLLSLRVFGARFGLESTLQLAKSVGHPQRQLRFIHVAGTNGKGSTCAMLESIYRAADLRVGLFTSPHLVSFRERIQVNRELISESDVSRLVAELRQACAGSQNAGVQREPGPTFFEFVTVMALKYFAEQSCDLVIWETGLGGRLDATNIVTPLASLITNIGLDHQQWLGDTLEQIAAEKAGIIKHGVPVVTAAAGVALEVIERVASERNAPFHRVGPSATGKAPALPLPGEHQRLNAALALAVVEVLQPQILIGEAQWQAGLARVDWPGRMQRIAQPSGRTVLLDGAHNAEGADALRTALQAGPDAGASRTLILGILGDKHYRAMCRSLAPLGARILVVPVNSERSASAAELAEICRDENPSADVAACASLREALDRSAGDREVVITGSLYLVGEAMELLRVGPLPDRDERSLNEWSVSQPTNQHGGHKSW